MKNVFKNFLDFSIKIKCIIVITIFITLTTGATVTAHFMGNNEKTKVATNLIAENLIKDKENEIIEELEESLQVSALI